MALSEIKALEEIGQTLQKASDVQASALQSIATSLAQIAESQQRILVILETPAIPRPIVMPKNGSKDRVPVQ